MKREQDPPQKLTPPRHKAALGLLGMGLVAGSLALLALGPEDSAPTHDTSLGPTVPDATARRPAAPAATKADPQEQPRNEVASAAEASPDEEAPAPQLRDPETPTEDHEFESDGDEGLEMMTPEALREALARGPSAREEPSDDSSGLLRGLRGHDDERDVDLRVVLDRPYERVEVVTFAEVEARSQNDPALLAFLDVTIDQGPGELVQDNETNRVHYEAKAGEPPVTEFNALPWGVNLPGSYRVGVVAHSEGEPPRYASGKIRLAAGERGVLQLTPEPMARVLVSLERDGQQVAGEVRWANSRTYAITENTYKNWAVWHAMKDWTDVPANRPYEMLLPPGEWTLIGIPSDWRGRGEATVSVEAGQTVRCELSVPPSRTATVRCEDLGEYPSLRVYGPPGLWVERCAAGFKVEGLRPGDRAQLVTTKQVERDSPDHLAEVRLQPGGTVSLGSFQAAATVEVQVVNRNTGSVSLSIESTTDTHTRGPWETWLSEDPGNAECSPMGDGEVRSRVYVPHCLQGTLTLEFDMVPQTYRVTVEGNGESVTQVVTLTAGVNPVLRMTTSP